MRALDPDSAKARRVLIEALDVTPETLTVHSDVPGLTRSDYTSVATTIVDRVSTVEGVRSVHQFGEVGAPGVSDLDVLIVLDPEAIPQCMEALDRVDSATLLHEPFYIPPTMTAGLGRIFPMNGLHRLHGEPTFEGAAEQASSLSPDQEVLTAVDFSLSVFSKSFFWLLRRGQIPLRDTLILIRLFCHSLSRIAPLAPDATARSWEQFVDASLRFRARWQVHGEAGLRRGLFEILATAAVLAIELTRVLARQVEQRQLGAGSAPRAFAYGRTRILFTDPATPEDAVGAQLRAARVSRLVWSVAPADLGRVLNGYSAAAGPYSRYLRSGLVTRRRAPDRTPRDRVPSPVFVRADLLNSLFACYADVGYTRTSPLAYYGYRPERVRPRIPARVIHRVEQVAGSLLARWIDGAATPS